MGRIILHSIQICVYNNLQSSITTYSYSKEKNMRVFFYSIRKQIKLYYVSTCEEQYKLIYILDHLLSTSMLWSKHYYLNFIKYETDTQIG